MLIYILLSDWCCCMSECICCHASMAGLVWMVLLVVLQSEVSVENLQRANRSLEQRLTLTQSELTAAKATLAATQGDYDSYKVSLSLSLVMNKSLNVGAGLCYFWGINFYLIKGGSSKLFFKYCFSSLVND